MRHFIQADFYPKRLFKSRSTSYNLRRINHMFIVHNIPTRSHFSCVSLYSRGYWTFSAGVLILNIPGELSRIINQIISSDICRRVMDHFLWNNSIGFFVLMNFLTSWIFSKNIFSVVPFLWYVHIYKVCFWWIFSPHSLHDSEILGTSRKMLIFVKCHALSRNI